MGDSTQEKTSGYPDPRMTSNRTGTAMSTKSQVKPELIHYVHNSMRQMNESGEGLISDTLNPSEMIKYARGPRSKESNSAKEMRI